MQARTMLRSSAVTLLAAVLGLYALTPAAVAEAVERAHAAAAGGGSAVVVAAEGFDPAAFAEAGLSWEGLLETKGADAPIADKYCASKALAERAAWKYWNDHRGEVGWDLVVLNPSFVYGPILHEVDKPEHLNESMRMFYDAAIAGTSSKDVLNWG